MKKAKSNRNVLPHQRAEQVGMGLHHLEEMT